MQHQIHVRSTLLFFALQKFVHNLKKEAKNFSTWSNFCIFNWCFINKILIQKTVGGHAWAYLRLRLREMHPLPELTFSSGDCCSKFACRNSVDRIHGKMFCQWTRLSPLNFFSLPRLSTLTLSTAKMVKIVSYV